MTTRADRRRETWRLEREFEDRADDVGVAWCDLDAAVRQETDGPLRDRYERALVMCVTKNSVGGQ